jgi:uncharacterized protein with PIN domain
METRFIVDAMLGRLSTWLRVMGYDTHYQMSYEEETIRRSVQEGRILLSRRARISEEHPGAIWMHSHHVGERGISGKRCSEAPPNRVVSQMPHL